MASTSNTSTYPQLEESAPYKPPATKIPLRSDKRYHVFLSFRGPDVRNTLVKDLFEALSAAGLIVFLDSEKLKKGEIIEESLKSAIESSAIRIPIFSRGYAASAWCLKEAAEMLKTPGLVIPLFCHVDPTHVRYSVNDHSPYKQAFQKHYSHTDRYSTEEIGGWKNALLEICKRSGWSTDSNQNFEARLVKMVVNDLIQTLDRVPLEVAKHPVGMDSVKNFLLQKLNLNSVEAVVKVGIWGIGGIGKTTVAKAIYNQIYASFEAVCFVFNVRATAAEATGLEKMQKQILNDLTKYDGKVEAVDEGISLFRHRLGGKHVLLILDDVDDVVQLNALVGDWLAPGSRVVLTSRDQHILNGAEYIHEITGLEETEGLQLFSWHAFLRASPNPKYQDLSRRIVAACKGHPLSLEVIGSSLYDKQNDTACWIEALHNITLNPEIHKRLYISYSDLTDVEKEIFVDVACFFVGEHKRFPIVFWKSLYKMVDTAVLNLSMKSLIKIDDEGVFEMHDHLQDMGRTIAETEKQGTRLWEGAHLSAVSNDVNFSRISLNGGTPQRLEILCRPGLRYLHLQNLHIEGMTKDTLAMLPPSLVWLRLPNCYIEIKRRSLKVVLGGQLKKPPYITGNLLQLQNLDLSNCTGLNKLPHTIGNLSQLQHLNLEQCWSLYKLPDTIGNLSQLQHLNLGRCECLNKLPDTIGNLLQLQHLNLEGCESLNELPDTVGNLSQLQYLNFEGCGSLNKLPNKIGNLSQLQHLNLKRLWSLNKLPDTIGNLSHLQHLNLFGCKSLNKLPDTIGKLSQLRHLNLEGCGSLNKLPDTIGNLSQLQHLNLKWCWNLNKLPDKIGNLTQLQYLNLFGCKSLNKLPDTVGNLSQLQNLNLEGCGNLNKIPHTIDNLSQLQHLFLFGCKSLNKLPDTIDSLSQLHLHWEGCDG